MLVGNDASLLFKALRSVDPAAVFDAASEIKPAHKHLVIKKMLEILDVVGSPRMVKAMESLTDVLVHGWGDEFLWHSKGEFKCDFNFKMINL